MGHARGEVRPARRHGWAAVQVAGIMTCVESAYDIRYQRLKLHDDEPLSTFAFKVNVRLYAMQALGALVSMLSDAPHFLLHCGRGLHSSTSQRQHELFLSLKPPKPPDVSLK